MILKISIFVGVLFFLVIGCSSQPDKTLDLEPTRHSEYLQSDFDLYVRDTRQWIKANRVFRSDDHAKEIEVNTPFELKPKDPTNKAILLIHGLSDSPYSFVDVSEHLVGEGFVVRTVLLPGHGAKPADLMLPSINNWLELVSHHTRLLQKDFAQVWIGGFSNGANLALIEAYNNLDVAGVLMFSPAIQSSNQLDFLAPYVARFKDWADIDPEVSITRFDSLTMNAAALYYESARRARELLDREPFTRPVLFTLSESDSVINADATLDHFNDRFTHPGNHLIWYGERQFENGNITSFSMDLPAHRISAASHMSVMYSPENPLYGTLGSIRVCNNGQSQSQEDACNNGAETWYASFDYRDSGKIYARLTWNPYFEQSMSIMKEVIN